MQDLEKKKNQLNTEQFSVKSVVMNLEDMMKSVTKKECNPSTVNAACNCADKITNLLKLQLEYQRMINKQ
jgi:hypothetical protein